jgi:hypothetical protein
MLQLVQHFLKNEGKANHHEKNANYPKCKKKISNPSHFLGKHRKHSILGKVEPIIFPYAPWEINMTDWLLCIPFGSAFVY